MSYLIKEIFYTLQGEGFHAGRPAVFCRFAGCNLWSGKEADRSNAVCQFCDTDFVGTDGPEGGKYETAAAFAEKVVSLWPAKIDRSARPFVICTGGEPLLQLDTELIAVFHHAGFAVAVETNGTILPPEGVDWLCVSPKSDTELVVRKGDELKLVFPQSGADPEKYLDLDFQYFFLQPQDGPDLDENIRLAVEYCLAYPQWQLSLQTHKIMGIK